MIWVALVAHAGSAAALLIMLSATLQPVLLDTAHPAHTLALEPGLRHLLFVYAATPRLSAFPMAGLAWRRAGPVGRAHRGFRRWFGAGVAALAAVSVVRALAAVVRPDVTTPAMWAARLRPPFPAVSATLTLLAAGSCWALALGEALACARGSADGPDVWDRRDAAVIMWMTAGISVAVARILAPLAVAFVLRVR